MKGKTTSLGIMSGSSLDGLDLCLAEFSNTNDTWKYDIKESWTLEVPDKIKSKLKTSSELPAIDLMALDIEYGKWIGNSIVERKISSDLIAIHGHTVFHSPEKGISLQIGNGEIINQITGIPTVASFRNKDIYTGGQGAPLVPMGEKLLLSQFDGFLNLGGICNGSFRKGTEMIGGDIGPCNQVLNYFAELLGEQYDDGGQHASKGNINRELIDQWLKIDFFSESFPKSLSNQWVHENFIQPYNCKPEDVLRTFSIFIAEKISIELNKYNPSKTLVTGGGAFNTYLIKEILSRVKTEIVLPTNDLINYKEALIFAFLGLLKIRSEFNVLSSCTGATHDTSSGVVYFS